MVNRTRRLGLARQLDDVPGRARGAEHSAGAEPAAAVRLERMRKLVRVSRRAASASGQATRAGLRTVALKRRHRHRPGGQEAHRPTGAGNVRTSPPRRAPPPCPATR
jgi:hypothetical protein